LKKEKVKVLVAIQILSLARANARGLARAPA
jgi:hypothetical protein